MAQGSAQREVLVGLLPTADDLPGWERSQPLQFFGPDNLWEYIDGAADLYLEYGFQAVVAAEYMTADSARSLTVEVYRMATPLGGFGIYAAERSPEDSIVAVGVQGRLSENTLNFWKGPFYVKLTSFDVAEDVPQVLTRAAQRIAQRIPGEFSQPALFSCFPEEQRVPHSERYIPRHFLGQAFLRDAYRVDYQHGAVGCQLFLMPTDSAGQAVQRLVHFARSQGQKVLTAQVRDVQVTCMGDDRWTMVFALRGLLGGAIGVMDPEAGKVLVERLLARLAECQAIKQVK
ncbi:MAG: hypothetical protein H5U38_08905 [Calditrichaeota bacterium]|nr:hypothetical protein [Calditrichota bacterium]